MNGYNWPVKNITNNMRTLEQKHGKPIREVLLDQLNEHQTLQDTADAMGFSKDTIVSWCQYFGIKHKRMWY